jgi:transposase-like protein
MFAEAVLENNYTLCQAFKNLLRVKTDFYRGGYSIPSAF